MTVFVALPAYNESKALPNLLEALRREMQKAGYASTVVLVDDGSTDDTVGAARGCWPTSSLELIRHPENRGLGETIRDALRHAAEISDEPDVIVSMDADNTQPPSLIPEMVRLLWDGYDVVIASRYRRGAAVVGLRTFRHVMSYGARLLFQALCPIPGVRDYTSGFRAYRSGVLKRGFLRYGDRFITEKSFAAMAEILLRLRLLNLRFCEVPMVLRYDQKSGASKMRILRTVWGTARLLLRHRFMGARA